MRVLVVLTASLFLAGCLAGSPPRSDPGLPGVTLPQDVPPTCDISRPAIVHTYDGQILSDHAGPVGVPCFSSSPWRGYEPTVGLTSDGSVFLYPAWPNTPFSQSIADRLNGMGIARSKDAGATWTRHVSSIGPVNYHPFTADPFMYVDAATNRIFMEDLIIPPFNCSNLSFSDDGGMTWRQTLGGCLVWDHVSIFAGKPVTSRPSGYPNLVYRCAINLVATTVISYTTSCQKSSDGGMTWGAPSQAFVMSPSGPYAPTQCNGAAHHVFVDHRGWVWLPRGWCNNPYVAVSKDETATWQRHQIHDKPVASGHEIGVAVDTNGTAYAFWFTEGDKPVLSVSRDDGTTWSPPRNVGIPGLVRGAMPSLEAGAPGRIAFTYVANLEGENPSGIHGIVVAATGADTDAPVFQSAIVTPPAKPLSTGNCRGQACSGQGDFLTMRIGPDGTPWGAFMQRSGPDALLSAGRLFGAPSMWDETDPNGRYKNP